MPKEIIWGDRPFGDESPEQSVVEVRWDAESGYFQIATKELNAEVFDADRVTDVREAVQYGWYVTLDRRGINDTIRVLRRARDQAFGRDE